MPAVTGARAERRTPTTQRIPPASARTVGCFRMSFETACLLRKRPSCAVRVQNGNRTLAPEEQAAATAAKDGCPVSQALRGNVEISVAATLDQGS